MRYFKKAMIAISSLALGLTIVGCSKKDVVIRKDDNVITASKKNGYEVLYNQRQQRVKTLKVINNSDRYLWYSTDSVAECCIYDYIYDKEVFVTKDKITDVKLYNNETDENVFIITFDDDSQEVIASNGKVLVEKGIYDDIEVERISILNNGKKDNFREVIFSVRTKKFQHPSEVSFYRLVRGSIKVDNKAIVNRDYHYTLTKITEEEASLVKKGEKYPEEENKYSYNAANGNIYFYKKGSNEVVTTLSYNTSDKYRAFVLGTKALVQIEREVDSLTNYDLYNGDYYFLDTYEIDLKNGSVKSIDNYKYYLIDQTTKMSIIYKDEDATDLVEQYFIFYNVGYISDKMLLTNIDLCMNTNLKVVQDDQKYVYNNNSFYDLGNGTYLVRGTNVSTYYLTDSNGNIKKVYNGFLTVLFGSKIIISSYNNEIRFIDFKGNYVGDVISGSSITYSDYNHYYYKDYKTNDIHLVTFDNGKIVSDEKVDYNVSSFTSITSVSNLKLGENYYYSANRCYFIAIPKDTNGDNINDAFSLDFYSSNGESLGFFDNVYNFTYESTTDINGRGCYVLFTRTGNTTNYFELSVDIIGYNKE